MIFDVWGPEFKQTFLNFFHNISMVIFQSRYISAQIIKRQTSTIFFCQKLYDIYLICLHGTDTPFNTKLLPFFEYWFVPAFSLWCPGCKDDSVSCFRNLICWCLFLENHMAINFHFGQSGYCLLVLFAGIVVELYQFLNIYYWLVRIFNSSDDALLVRAKRQILRKTWISRLDLYLITSD